VVGGGFGGLYAASYLACSEFKESGGEVVLIDRRNHFTFTPLLAEVAGGSLGREHVTHPFRSLAAGAGFRFLQAQAHALDRERAIIATSVGEIGYDYLVLAAGAEPNFFGNRELERHGLPLTTTNEALRVRARVLGAIERWTTSRDDCERARLLTFVVAGAGPAGVEIASEIRHLAGDVMKRYLPEMPSPKVVLADAGDRILTAFDPELAAIGQAKLRERGIDLCLNTRIEGCSERAVTLLGPDGRRVVEAATLLWTAGTRPAAWVSDLDLPTERGALKVDRYLRVEGCERVFAVGDAAYRVDERTDRRYPPVAPIAISQGVRAAANIENHALGREPEPYEAHHAGKIVSLGDGTALADVLGLRLTGWAAWLTYRTTYILKLVGTKNKIRVLVSLMLNKIFEPDISYEASE